MHHFNNRQYYRLSEHTAQSALECYLEYLDHLSLSAEKSQSIPASFVVKREKQDTDLYKSKSLVEDQTGRLATEILDTQLIPDSQDKQKDLQLFSRRFIVNPSLLRSIENLRCLIHSLDCEYYEVTISFDHSSKDENELRNLQECRKLTLYDIFELHITIQIGCHNWGALIENERTVQLSLEDNTETYNGLRLNYEKRKFDHNELAKVLPDIDAFTMTNCTSEREPYLFKSDLNEMVAYDPFGFENVISHALGTQEPESYQVIDSMLTHYAHPKHLKPIQPWVIGRVEDYPSLAAMDDVDIVTFTDKGNGYSFDVVSLWHQLTQKRTSNQFGTQPDLLVAMMLAGLELKEDFLVRCKLPAVFRDHHNDSQFTIRTLLQACDKIQDRRMSHFVELYRANYSDLEIINNPAKPLWSKQHFGRAVIFDTSCLSPKAALQITLFAMMSAIASSSTDTNSQPKIVSFNVTDIELEHSGEVIESCLHRLSEAFISSFACYVPSEKHQFRMPDWIYNNAHQSFECHSKTIKANSQHNWRPGNLMHLESVGFQ
ncbi:hypothetical protein J4N45_09930 [Vibrio sp. SCSIO 43140]|uniref:hypothetical protein n=1 Tax=Vibrio sp. SCSIO 43140 TaxID=2819100 RepID=UPI002076123A|nr:hypothetical protein [Vibrio sp. SCSIO 43140]USD58847.1 hypothetical protein J4N45_09930 [Vibrio sp. SCSIO 43140]